MSVFLESVIYRMSLEFKTSSTEKYFHSGLPFIFMYITRQLAQTTNTNITDQIWEPNKAT